MSKKTCGISIGYFIKDFLLMCEPNSHTSTSTRTHQQAGSFKAICSPCRWLRKINKFSPEAFGENKHVFACRASQLLHDICAPHVQRLPLHERGRAAAVYVQGLCDGRFLDSAWSSPQFIYPRPLDLSLDLPQFVRLKGAPYRMEQFLRFHISSHSQLPLPSSN